MKLNYTLLLTKNCEYNDSELETKLIIFTVEKRKQETKVDTFNFATKTFSYQMRCTGIQQGMECVLLSDCSISFL